MQPLPLPDATITAALALAGLVATVVTQFVKKATGQNDLAALYLTYGIAAILGAAVAYQTGALNINFAWTNPLLLIAQVIQAMSVVFAVATLIYKQWVAHPATKNATKAKVANLDLWWDKLAKIWEWLKLNEPKFSRAVGLVMILWVALVEFARLQAPVLKDLFWTLYPLVLELWRIIAG